MSIHKLIKEAMDKHKSKIELTQWAVISSIASMIYSDYIYHFSQKQYPSPHVLVPAISSVKHFLSENGRFTNMMRDKFFEKVMKNDMFTGYMTVLPELEMFHGNNIELMETIFDLYIIPNVTRHIPNVISKKFQLDSGSQVFRESVDIPVMNIDQNELDDHIQYVADEFVLQILMLCPTLQRETIVPESNFEISVPSDTVLSINNEMAICPIHFTPNIWKSSQSLLSKIKFVTNTEIISSSDSEYTIRTNAFNQVTITTLEHVDSYIQRNDLSHPE